MRIAFGRRAGSALVAIAGAAAMPSTARACPLCFAAAGERTLNAYYATAALLTLLPLAIIVLFGVWLRQRVKSEPS